MPSRRETIAMTPVELSAYLAEQRRIILITNGANGLPHPMPMNYGVDEQGRIVIVTFRKSQKVKNLERDPRATISVESGEFYHEIKSVMAQCDAEIIREFEPMRAAMQHIRSANGRPHSEGAQEQITASYTKRVVIRLTPRRYISWDHSKLGDKY